VIGDVGFNTQVLLAIDPEKKENQVSLYFTSLRPKTVLGNAQGDILLPINSLKITESNLLI
jgi:hypothetical protein